MKKMKSLLSMVLALTMLFSMVMPTALAAPGTEIAGYGFRILGAGPKVADTTIDGAPVGPAVLSYTGKDNVAGIRIIAQTQTAVDMGGTKSAGFVIKYDNTKLQLLDYEGNAVEVKADKVATDIKSKYSFKVLAKKAGPDSLPYDVMDSKMYKDGGMTYLFYTASAGVGDPKKTDAEFMNFGSLSFKLLGYTGEMNDAAIKRFTEDGVTGLTVNSLSIGNPDSSQAEKDALMLVARGVYSSVIIASANTYTAGKYETYYGSWKTTDYPNNMAAASVYVDYPGVTNVAPYEITTLAPTFQDATAVTVPVVLPTPGADVVRQTAVVVTDSTSSTQHTLPTNAVWSLAYSDATNGTYAPLTDDQKAFISMDAKTGAITVKAGAPVGFLKATVKCGNTVASDGTASGTEVAGTTASLELTREIEALRKLERLDPKNPDSVITLPKVGEPAKRTTYSVQGRNQYGEIMASAGVNWITSTPLDWGLSAEGMDTDMMTVIVDSNTQPREFIITAQITINGSLLKIGYNINITRGIPTANIPTASGDVTLAPEALKDDSGSYTAEKDTVMTLPTAAGGKTLGLASGTVITPINPADDKATQLELTGGPVSLPAKGLVTLANGTKMIVNLDGSAELPAGSTIEVGGKTLTLVSGATVAADGTITIPAGGIVKEGTPEATITYPAGGTVPPTGVVTVPEGGTIAVGGSTVTVGKPEATVDPNGKIKLPAGGSVTIGTPATTLTPPAGGGTITIDTNGNVTNAPGGAVTMPEGSVVTPPAGESVVIDKTPGGIAKVPGGSTITNDKGNSSITIPSDKNDVTIDKDGNINLPTGGTVEVGKAPNTSTVTVPGNTTLNPDDNGKVELPSGSEITQPGGNKVTTGGGNTTLNPDGSVTIPGGSTVTDKNDNTSTPTAPGGTLKPDGTVDMPEGGIVTTPTQNIVVTKPGSVIVDDKGNITLPGGGTVTTAPNGAITVPGGGSIANDGSVTYPKDQPATSGTGDTVVTPPTGGSVVVKPDGSITVTDKDTVTVPGTGTITLPEGGTVAGNGDVTTVPGGSITTPGGSVVKPGTTPNDTVTVKPGDDGTITIPDGGTVTQPDGGQIVLPGGGSLKPDGSITSDSDQPVKIPGMGGKDEITVTPGPGGSVTIDKDGNIDAGTGGTVTLPNGGGTVTVTPPNKIEVGIGGGVTLPGGGTISGGSLGDITVNPGETVQPGGGITPVPGTDVKVGDTGIVVKPGDNNVSATTNPDKSVTVPNGGIISIPAKAPNPAVEIKLPQGGSITVDGVITVPADGSVTLGGTTVKPATGETITIEDSGKVVLPDGTTVMPGGGSASIVVNPTGETELKPDGSVTFPNGGTVTVGGQTVTIPNGSKVDNMGNITLPVNGTVTMPGGVTVTPTAGGKVVILPDGTVKLPQGGTKNPGATSVGAGGSVSIDGIVTQPSNPGGGGSGGGTVTPPAKSESVTITVKADGNGVATVDDAALKNALETAAKSGATTVIIDAGGKTIVLTQPQLKMLADNKNIKNVEFKTPLYRLRLDKSAQISVAAETKGKITVSFSDGMNLDPETKVQKGKSPVAEVTMTSENGAVTKLGGTGTIFFNYTLQAGETADMLTGLYLPKNATAQRLPARYDAKMKMAEVDTTHLSAFSFTFDTMRFSDVKGWASDYIYHLANRGVVKGVTADMYMPDANVTRSEFVTLLARMSGAKLPAGTTKFMDVAADAWYAPSVAWAVSAGITKGTGEGYFNPDMPISRQDMAAMLARYTQHMGKQPDKAAEAMTFADAASIAPYAVEAVTLMQQAGVINGRDGGNFAPMANATRGECAKMMSALLYAID